MATASTTVIPLVNATHEVCKSSLVAWLTHNIADGGISIVEMLFCTSLVALVGIGNQPAMSPRRLHIINTKRNSVICELTFPTAVLSVKMNRKRLVVVLEEAIHIYNISNMKLLHSIETSPNPTGKYAGVLR